MKNNLSYKWLSFSIIPKDNKAQALRVKRGLYTLLGALIHTFLCVVLWVVGYFQASQSEFILIFSVIWAGYIAYFIVLRTGFNQRFKDPKLTMPMMLWVISSLMFTVFLTIDLRAVLLMYFLLTLVFGSFHLKREQQNFLALYGVFLYLLSIIVFVEYYPGVASLKKELAVFFCYAAVSLALTIVCSKMNELRKRLKNKNERLQLALKQISAISITDELTGLKNRRYIFEILEEQRLMAGRGQYSFSICIMDIDYFKQVNDTYGHILGDKVLKRLAQRILSVLRKIDYLARFGGEEFLLICPFTDKAQGTQTANRIRETIEQASFDNLVPNLKMTLSMGVTEFRWPEKIETTLTRADMALYKAKHEGRNQVVTE